MEDHPTMATIFFPVSFALLCWTSISFASDLEKKSMAQTQVNSVQNNQTKNNQTKNSQKPTEAKADLKKGGKKIASKEVKSDKQPSATSTTASDGKKDGKQTGIPSDNVAKTGSETLRETSPKTEEVKSNEDELVTLNKLYDSSIKALIDQRCQGCHVERKSNFSDFSSTRNYAEKAHKNMKIGMMPPKPIPPEERSQLLDFFDKLRKYSN